MKPAYGDLSQKPGITKVYAHPYWCVKISGEGGGALGALGALWVLVHWEHWVHWEHCQHSNIV